MNLVRMHVERLMKSVELPELNLPTWDVEEQGEPTNAAIWLRRSWGLPKGRIENLTKVVEDNGIVVISFNFGTEKMDGLSMQTKDKQPLIFINKAISGDRQRFTLAHEVGHLVMHIGQRVSDFRDVEKEAMQFAAELLVPASEFQKEAEYISLESLGDLKRYWKVSMGSLLFRVKELGLVTENRYRYLWQQMAMKGYKTHEQAALNIPRETPTLMKEIIMMHINELGYKKDELSTMLNIIEADLEELYFNDQVKLKIVRN